MRSKQVFLVGAIALFVAGYLHAEMHLASVFSDHMVVAAEKPVRVFGTGEGKATVTFEGVTVAAQSGNGAWCATLPAMPAGGPYELTVDIEGGRRILSDVMVGEVLILAGQLNIQFTLGESTSDPRTWVEDPRIQMFSTTRLEQGSRYAAKDGWVALNQVSASSWSAIGHFDQLCGKTTDADEGR